jgi:gliding motility-associated-like protein
LPIAPCLFPSPSSVIFTIFVDRPSHFKQNIHFVERLNRVLAFVIFIISVEIEQGVAQCPGSETCEDAYVFCSLDELNGFSCNTPSTTRATCLTYCIGGGMGSGFYRTWWAFITQGGNATITLHVGTCIPGPITPVFAGILVGFMGDCNCNENVLCIPHFSITNETYVYQLVNLKPCKVYYMFFDHGDDNCDFTINTSGGGPPTLSPIGKINEVASGIIEPVCQGICDYKFSIKPLTGNCLDITYIWTLDGVEVGNNKNELVLDFPDQGDFVICVTAYLGDPKSGSVCNQQGPQCATVKVRPLPERMGKLRTLCYETANSGYQWHSQIITSSGTYREQLKENNCCHYDSVVQFTVLPEVNPTEIFYLSCDNKPYVDLLGLSYPLCTDHLFITLPKSTDHYKCDSAILLTSVNIGLVPHWTAQCQGGQVELSPNIQVIDTCSLGARHTLNYKWYLKADTSKHTIGNTQQLKVDTVNKDYCLDVAVKVLLGADSAMCIKTLCDTINETEAGGSLENILLRYCDSAIFNGQTYHQTTTFTQQLKTVQGCDSIINTIINIQKASTTNFPSLGCDSIRVNDQTYFQSGDYTQQLSSSNGCDSVINIHAEIYKTKFSALFNSGCDSVKINGQAYLLTGQYTQLLKTTEGCDSVLRIDADVYKSSIDHLSYNACDSIDINGKIYKQSGNYIQKLFSVHGCDSILNLEVDIQPSSQTEFRQSACDSVVFNGKIYKQSGDYTERYTGVNGCDSIIVLHVNIPNSNTSPLILSKCDTVTINGILYNQSGIYTQKLISKNGCDSILNIDLTISKSNKGNLSYRTCDSLLIHGHTYYQSGHYSEYLKTIDNCDSILDLDLNVFYSSPVTNISLTGCDSVIVCNRFIARQNGNFICQLMNVDQCDSLVFANVNIIKPIYSEVFLKGCDSIRVNGQNYYQSGLYRQFLKGVEGCDSIINLELIVNQNSKSDFITSSCDTAIINGKIYTQSGKYLQSLINSEGCDSTLNIDVRIWSSSQTDYSQTGCDSAVINGQIFKQSGSYQQILSTVNGCDSILNLEIEIQRSGKAEIEKEACDSIIVNNVSYTQSGIYKQILQSSSGCDSTLTLDLTIKPGNPSTLDAGKDTSICEGETIELNGIFTGNASFNWQGARGNFDHPDQLTTSFYSNIVGNERIYLYAEDDCKQWLDSLDIQILPNQFVRVTGDTIIDPCKNQEIRFTASGGTKYTWTPSSYIECLDPPCSHVLLKSNRESRFTITTDGPCAFPANLNLSLSQTQSDVYLPTAFSPNGDNINDIFQPIFNCDAVTFFNLQIFDRWGNLLFESNDQNKGWDGRQQDEYLNPGVYPYVLQYELHGTGNKVKSGDVTIIR